MDSQQHLRIDRAIFLHSGSLGSGSDVCLWGLHGGVNLLRKRDVTESRHVGTAQPAPGPRNGFLGCSGGSDKDSIAWSTAVAFVPYDDRISYVPQRGGHE
jgi:hypothetical protein